MRRLAPALFLASLGLTFAAPLLAHAAGIPFFGPIVPPANDLCPGNWGALIQVVNNIIAFLITIAVVFIAPLTIAYGGFLYVTSGGSPGARSKANGVMLNAVVGIVVALASWIIVDAVMSVFYNGNYGTWYSFIVGDTSSPCLQVAGSLNEGVGANGQTGFVSGITAGGTNILAGTGVQCSATNPNCSVAALENAGFTANQAAAMSCIAMTENSGNAAGCNGNACGVFQIEITVNQLSGGQCAQYNNGNPTINCPALCHGNNGVAAGTAACAPCVTAAQNAACNAESANAMFQKSGYAPWTTSSDNTKSGVCVQTYDPTGA